MRWYKSHALPFLGSIRLLEAIAASSCRTKGEGAASERTAGTDAERVSDLVSARSEDTATPRGGLTVGAGGVGTSRTGISARASSRGGDATDWVDLTVAVPGGGVGRVTEVFGAADVGATLFGAPSSLIAVLSPARALSTGFPALAAIASGFFSETGVVLLSPDDGSSLVGFTVCAAGVGSATFGLLPGPGVGAGRVTDLLSAL